MSHKKETTFGNKSNNIVGYRFLATQFSIILARFSNYSTNKITTSTESTTM